MFIQKVLAADIEVSKMYNPATKIPVVSTISDLLTKGGFNLIEFIFILISLAFFVNLVMAGWDYMLSTGDPKKIASATSRLTNGVVGFVMALTAFIVVRIISAVILGPSATPLI